MRIIFEVNLQWCVYCECSNTNAFSVLYLPKQTCVLLLVIYNRNMPSVLWRCWLGGRKSIRPVKNRVVVYWRGLSVCSEVQTCIWPSWCHCHSLSLAPVKSRLVLPFWYRLTQVSGKEAVKWSLLLLNGPSLVQWAGRWFDERNVISRRRSGTSSTSRLLALWFDADDDDDDVCGDFAGGGRSPSSVVNRPAV